MRKKIIQFIEKNKVLHKFLLRIKNSKQFRSRLIQPRFLHFILRRKTPISNIYGLDRGQAIDRYYIENFLNANQKYIKGYCLEILNNNYTLECGGNKVAQSDILDIDSNNSNATINGDLRNLENIHDGVYDCIILTQALQFIDDYESAIKECCRILKPRGVLLVTLPSISRIDCVAKVEGDYWRFTIASANYIFNKFFQKNNLEIEAYGNCLVGQSFWVGLAQEELSRKELDYYDPNFPCLITIKAIK